MSNGTATTTMPAYHEEYSPIVHSGILSSSITSLPGSRHQASQIAKTYRQAAQLFLTRRLPEALSTIEPVITPQPTESSDGEQSGEEKPVQLAPIATVSKGTRVKVWSFYLTFLNSVIELGPEEGKHAFGTTKWKALVNKTRDGSIWEEVVRVGYAGNEGAVDADVVINLYVELFYSIGTRLILHSRATLLLTHSPDQSRTQMRLETYLSSLSNPTFDITHSHLSQQKPRLGRHLSSHGASGTNTPRDLHTHLKLLELYTLHVLPRNGEWDYAREFIMMSEMLDDERKEAFLQALHGLKEEQDMAAMREKELAKQQKEQLEQQRQQEEEERRLAEEARVEEERRREEAKRRPQRPPDAASKREHASSVSSSRPRSSGSAAHSQNGTTSRPSRQPKKEVSRRAPPTTLYARASALLIALRTMLFDTAQGLANNPMALLRTLLFVLAFALAFGRRDLRERVRRIVQRAWEKVRATVGMGVKVSYI
jgi:hypothetical protein